MTLMSRKESVEVSTMKPIMDKREVTDTANIATLSKETEFVL